VTIDYLDGFETQYDDSTTFDITHGYWTFTEGLANITFPAGRTGVSCKIVETATPSRLISADLPASQQRHWSFFFRIPAAPSVISDLYAASVAGGGTNCLLLGVNTNSTLRLSIAGSGLQASSFGVCDNAWHRLDMYLNSSGTTHTIDWKVDGVTQTQVSVAGQAARDPVRQVIGSSSVGHTLTFEIDDFVSGSNGATEYPFNAGQPYNIYALSPNADGTHNAGTNIIEDQAGNDIGVVTAWDLLEEIPPTTTEYVRQNAAGSGNYAEVAFADTVQSIILAVCGFVLGGAVQGSNPTATIRIVDSAGATLIDLYSGNVGGGSATDRTLNLRIPDPGGDGWSTADLNGLKLRVGFSPNASASITPKFGAAMLQYVAVPSPPTTRRLRTVSTPIRW